MLRDEREKYEQFWQSFGRQLKVCAMDNYGAKKETLQDLMLFYSSTEKKLVTLAEYVGRMKEDQKFIYYASGDTVEAIDHMPQTELLKEHSMENPVLHGQGGRVSGRYPADVSGQTLPLRHRRGSWSWAMPRSPMTDGALQGRLRLHQGDAGRPRGHREGVHQARRPIRCALPAARASPLRWKSTSRRCSRSWA